MWYIFVLICKFILATGNPNNNNTLQAVDKRNDCPCGSSSRYVRVVGGHDAGHGNFPYASCLINNFEFRSESNKSYQQFCGATLITDLHVVTAAHCVKYRLPEEILVDVGDYSLHTSPEGQLRAVRSIKKFGSYQPGQFHHDIAILEIDRPVRWSSGVRAALLPLPDFDLPPGTVVSVYGWGRLNYSDVIRPDHLQSAEMPIVANDECQNNFMTKIRENMLCAGGQMGHDACIGDSGSGLVVRMNNEYVLCGLVSFGRQCALPSVPGVYTRLSNYSDWIYRNTISAHCKPCFNHQSDFF